MAIEYLLKNQKINEKRKFNLKKIAGLALEAVSMTALGLILLAGIKNPISNAIEQRKFRQDYQTARIEYARECLAAGNDERYAIINGRESVLSENGAVYISDGTKVSDMDLALWIKEYQSENK